MAYKTPFYDLHIARSAAMVEHQGWLIPEHYGDAAGECVACREKLAVFDLSYLSRIRIAGTDATEMLETMLTVDVGLMIEDTSQRDLLRDDRGEALDDVLIQRHKGSFLLIGSEGNRQAMLDVLGQGAADKNVKVTDETFKTAMVSLRGPAAIELARDKLPFDVDDMRPGDLSVQTYFFMRFVISIDEEFGLDGVTIILPAKMAGMAWEMLEKYGHRYGIVPAGFTAFEMLRGNSGPMEA